MCILRAEFSCLKTFKQSNSLDLFALDCFFVHLNSIQTDLSSTSPFLCTLTCVGLDGLAALIRPNGAVVVLGLGSWGEGGRCGRLWVSQDIASMESQLQVVYLLMHWCDWGQEVSSTDKRVIPSSPKSPEDQQE